ncbi:MAG: SulP family inorganic anion transporter [Chloroflexota bacterium]
MELPVAHWLPRYRRAWLAHDAIAGITVWALIVPEAMAYAAIAGVPVQFGLYAVPLSLLGYVVFGSSRQLFVGPSATVASISAVAVGSVAVAGAAPSQFVALTSALALMVGALYVLLGIARMGFVARFFAKPVLDGFIIGLGLFIGVGQIPKLVGIHKPSGDTIRVLVETLWQIGSWQWWTVGTGVVALATLFGLARYAPKVPGALVVVAASLVLVPLLGLADHGVAIVGPVPTGFHFVSWSGIGWHDLVHLLPGALAIVVVGFAQSVAIAKAYAAKYHYPVDANQELIGYGAANLGAGALQGYTVTGSLSKSAAAEEAGGKSPVLLLVAGAGVLLTVVALAGLFANLPEAVLAAVVIHAVSGMVDFSKLTVLRRARLPDFWPALGALLGVVVIGILPGVLIGVALSFGLLIHALDHPHVAILGRDGTGRRFRERDRNAGFEDVPDTVIHRFEAPLIFANADIFTDSVHASVAAADAPPRTLILDFAAVADVDTTGSQALRTLRSEYDGGTALLLARVPGTVRDALRADGTLAAIGEERVFPTIRDAVASTER